MDRRARVISMNAVNERVLVKVGVRQGCVMSPLRFNLNMEEVASEVQTDTFGSGARLVGDGKEYRELKQLLFADEALLVEDSKEILERWVTEFRRVCRRRKLKMNVWKSKHMHSARH